MNGHSFPPLPGGADRVKVVLTPPFQKGLVYLGQLRFTYDDGYKRDYIMRLLKSKAAELGADIIHIKEQKKVDTGLVVAGESVSGSSYTTQNKKIKMILGIYRSIKQ